MMYLLTVIGLSPGGSITIQIYTQTIHRTTQITTLLVGSLSTLDEKPCTTELVIFNLHICTYVREQVSG